MDCKVIETMTLDNLFNNIDICSNDWRIDIFSAEDAYPSIERLKLEEKYWNITCITDKFNRQSVSYQLSKKDRLSVALRSTFLQGSWNYERMAQI